MRSREPRCFSFLLLLLGQVSLATVVTAGTLHVGASGIDADGCGAKAAPCRSITRAINNAVPGDKVLVGPGRYGDLDADGTLGEAGEEGGTRPALVTVDKPLTILSVEGAATTVIDANGVDVINGAVVDGVVIAANGVQLGKAKKGFTITGARNGVFINSLTTGVTVTGIRAVRNQVGFASKSPGLVFRGNVAEANSAGGFTLTGGGCAFTACRATANGGNGFTLKGDGHVVKSCVASANAETGFDLTGNGTAITKSVGNGNTVGLSVGVESNPGQLGTNAFLGNLNVGVVVASPGVTLTKSNVFGNGSVGGNCGVTVSGAGAVTLDKICFGAPTGPGDDPADQTCGAGNAIEILEVLEKVIAISPKVPL